MTLVTPFSYFLRKVDWNGCTADTADSVQGVSGIAPTSDLRRVTQRGNRENAQSGSTLSHLPKSKPPVSTMPHIEKVPLSCLLGQGRDAGCR